MEAPRSSPQKCVPSWFSHVLLSSYTGNETLLLNDASYAGNSRTTALRSLEAVSQVHELMLNSSPGLRLLRNLFSEKTVINSPPFHFNIPLMSNPER